MLRSNCIQSFGINSTIDLHILLWLALGSLSFSSNDIEEMNPGFRNLQTSLIVVKLCEILLGVMQQKYGLWKLKSSLVCGFRNRGWSRISSIDLGVGKALLGNCSQALSSWIKISSLFWFCKFLCLVERRIWFCLNKRKPWLEFKIKSHRYQVFATNWFYGWVVFICLYVF